MVGREIGRIIVEDRPDGGRFLEFPGQETPHLVPLPAGRMHELPVEGKIALVKGNRLERGRFVWPSAADGLRRAPDRK